MVKESQQILRLVKLIIFYLFFVKCLVEGGEVEFSLHNFSSLYFALKKSVLYPNILQNL